MIDAIAMVATKAIAKIQYSFVLIKSFMCFSFLFVFSVRSQLLRLSRHLFVYCPADYLLKITALSDGSRLCDI